MFSEPDTPQDHPPTPSLDECATLTDDEIDDGAATASHRPRDTYQDVTDRIVEALDAGVAPWVQPWQTPHVMPHNGVTKRLYSGVNVLLLWMTALERRYASPDWYTFNQACAAVGLQRDDRGRWVYEAGKGVRKGEHGTYITLWRTITVRDASTAALPAEPTTRDVPLLRGYVVFNRAQIEGLPKTESVPELPEYERLQAVDQFVARTGAMVREERTALTPSYAQEPDVIEMPPLGCFHTVEDFYAALLHELTHWTGHRARLARDLSVRFGSSAYAKEELVAELGAAFLCADLQIPGRLQVPEYLAHWAHLLREDKRAIFRASSLARAAVEYLHGVGDPPSDDSVLPPQVDGGDRVEGLAA